MQNQISSEARIGKNVSIGPYSTVLDCVEIGDNTVIESHCVIGVATKMAEGKSLVIAENSHIRSHSVLYAGSAFGPHLVTGHSAIIRENCQSGRNVQVGAYAEVEADVVLGNYVKIHSRVNVANKTKVGDFVWIYPAVQLTNDPLPPSDVTEGIVIKDMAVIATGSLLMPGVTVGIGSLVGAGSVVKYDVPEVHCVGGNPAKVICSIDRLLNIKHGLSYPWATHFRTGYPVESHSLMDSIVDRISILINENRNKGKT